MAFKNRQFISKAYSLCLLFSPKIIFIFGNYLFLELFTLTLNFFFFFAYVHQDNELYGTTLLQELANIIKSKCLDLYIVVTNEEKYLKVSNEFPEGEV